MPPQQAKTRLRRTFPLDTRRGASKRPPPPPPPPFVGVTKRARLKRSCVEEKGGDIPTPIPPPATEAETVKRKRGRPPKNAAPAAPGQSASAVGSVSNEKENAHSHPKKKEEFQSNKRPTASRACRKPFLRRKRKGMMGGEKWSPPSMISDEGPCGYDSSAPSFHSNFSAQNVEKEDGLKSALSSSDSAHSREFATESGADGEESEVDEHDSSYDETGKPTAPCISKLRGGAIHRGRSRKGNREYAEREKEEKYGSDQRRMGTPPSTRTLPLQTRRNHYSAPTAANGGSKNTTVELSSGSESPDEGEEERGLEVVMIGDDDDASPVTIRLQGPPKPSRATRALQVVTPPPKKPQNPVQTPVEQPKQPREQRVVQPTTAAADCLCPEGGQCHNLCYCWQPCCCCCWQHSLCCCSIPLCATEQQCGTAELLQQENGVLEANGNSIKLPTASEKKDSQQHAHSKKEEEIGRLAMQRKQAMKQPLVRLQLTSLSAENESNAAKTGKVGAEKERSDGAMRHTAVAKPQLEAEQKNNKKKKLSIEQAAAYERQIEEFLKSDGWYGYVDMASSACIESKLPCDSSISVKVPTETRATQTSPLHNRVSPFYARRDEEENEEEEEERSPCAVNAANFGQPGFLKSPVSFLSSSSSSGSTPSSSFFYSAQQERSQSPAFAISGSEGSDGAAPSIADQITARCLLLNPTLPLPSPARFEVMRMDGHCFFSSVAHIVKGDRGKQQAVRQELVQRLREAIDENERWIIVFGSMEELESDMERWLRGHSDDWGVDLLLFVAAKLYSLNFALYQPAGSQLRGARTNLKYKLFSPQFTGNSAGNVLVADLPLAALLFNGVDHFDVCRWY